MGPLARRIRGRREMTDLELRVYTATVRGEAEGEGAPGMIAVAWALRNRVTRPRWPNDIIGVCLQPLQVSFWNGDSKRRARLLRDESPRHRAAERICIAAWDSLAADPTDGADHYNTLKADPPWDDDMFLTVTIKNHEFFDSRRDKHGNQR